ncbi:MAG: hypothetical protein GY772_23775 [bacterium]|nr:hypothetical protein [bacterium]MCP4730070.1 hypothetical protein [Roseibacillus sp.]MCP4852857.1 hypothetical protein [Actinomycetes bacterium]
MDIVDARDELVERLATRPDLGHVKVRKHGSSLILYSGARQDDEQKHARLTHLSASTWGLSFPHHSGRWEKTPFEGSPAELLDTLVSDFAFYLDQY